MFVPKYIITNKILRYIGIIEGSREIILNSPLIPAWEAKFRKEAADRFVHHGTHIEGNQLSLEQAQQVLDGMDVVARDRDVQEVINYRNVLRFLEYLAAHPQAKELALTFEAISRIHQLTVDRLVPEEYSGKFRTRQVVVKNSRTGEISYTPPPAPEVPYLMEDLLTWLKSPDSNDVHPVIKAGIVHYELARIHPFVEGNGRTARAMATLILFLENYDIRKLFSLEEYFDSNPLNYYLTLQQVSNQEVLDGGERNLTPWLEYFIEGVAVELNKVKERIKKISLDSKMKDQLGQQIELNERQMMIMEFLNRNKTLQNKDFRKIFPDFSDDTVLRELKFLRSKGLIKKVGGTKKAAYVLR